ncbi:hypothetical protein P4404_004565 [Escherichia coli]|nr:hypothetical protein [Escherichia coli]ELS7769687.1 hypothetical protein [Escherichia coli]
MTLYLLALSFLPRYSSTQAVTTLLAQRQLVCTVSLHRYGTVTAFSRMCFPGFINATKRIFTAVTAIRAQHIDIQLCFGDVYTNE